MAKDLRSFLQMLDRHEQLVRLKKGVDPLTEMSALAWQALPHKAIFYEKITGFPNWQACCGIVESRQRVALVLGVAPEQVLPEYSRICAGDFLNYEKVSDGPVKEVIWTGKDVDLRKLPIIKPCERDAGPFLTFSETVCRDPDTGIYNTAVLRIQIKSENKTGIYCVPGKHTWEIYRKYENLNRPMPVAIVIGHHPAFHLAGTWAGPMDVDEYRVASAFLGEPLRLLPAETVDLLVPADAEAIIEGEIPPEIREPEGPHAEFTGYYPKIGRAHV